VFVEFCFAILLHVVDWLSELVFRRVRKIAKSDCYFRHVCPSVRHSARNNSALPGQIFIQFYIWVFSENLSRKFKFY